MDVFKEPGGATQHTQQQSLINSQFYYADDPDDDQPLEVISEQMMEFEEWINRIYFNQTKVKQLCSQYGELYIQLPPLSIAQTIRKIQRQTCKYHLEIIKSSLQIVQKMKDNSHYYKIDADRPTNYFEGEPKKNNQAHNQEPESSIVFSKEYYEYSLWVIYQHFCSIASANRQACLLSGILRQYNMVTAKVIRQYLRKMNDHQLQDIDDEGQKGLQNDQFQIQNIQQKQLHMLCAGYFIPLIIPTLFDNPTVLEQLLNIKVPNKISFQISLNYTTFSKQLYETIRELNIYGIKQELEKIEKTIYFMIHGSQQNMRVHCLYIEEFNESIRMIREKTQYLASSISLHLMQNQLKSSKDLLNPFQSILDHYPINSSSHLDHQLLSELMQIEDLKNSVGFNEAKISIDEANTESRITAEIIKTKITDNKKTTKSLIESEQTSEAQKLADAQPKFQQRIISKEIQSFNFKAVEKNYCRPYKERYKPLENSKIEERLQKALGPMSYDIEVNQNNNYTLQSENEKYFLGKDMGFKEMSWKVEDESGIIERYQKIKSLDRASVENGFLTTNLHMKMEHKKKEKEEIIFQYFNDDEEPAMDKEKVHQLLDDGEDYDFNVDEEIMTKKKKKKKNKKKKKKNKETQQHQLDEIPELKRISSVQSESIVNPVKNLPADFSTKTKETIKFLLNTKINKEARIEGYHIKNQMIQKWAKQFQELQLSLDNQEKSMPKSKNKKLGNRNGHI